MKKGKREKISEKLIKQRNIIIGIVACALLLGLLSTQADAAVAAIADNGSDNLPFDFNYSTPITWLVPNGSSYAGIASVVIGVEGGGSNFVGTTMEILHGVNNSGSATTVSMAWRTRIDIEVDGHNFISLPGEMQFADPVSQVAIAWDSYNNSSDVVDLDGVIGPYVLQSTYNDQLLFFEKPEWTEKFFAERDCIYLGWLEEVITGGELQNYYEWRRATEGNTGIGTNPVSNFQGTFDEFIASIGGLSNFDYSVYLGSYGVDIEENVVWAVLNHNSIFSAVPEPATIAILGLGTLLIRRKK